MTHVFLNNGDVFDPVDTAGVIEPSLREETREGEKAFMLAGLEDAIECFQKHLLAKDDRGRELFEEVEEWVWEKNTKWLFSFENICRTLLLDPDYIRQGLLCWKEERLKTQSKRLKVHCTG